MKKIAIGAAALVLSTITLVTSASAMIVCNREGECWHVRGHRYEYRPEFGLVVHPDSWRWRAHERFVWREHEGRGYWRNGVWVEF
ncbi:MAG: hypothetical protein JO261_12480 [Alphaproteobacteria bacterium]|nr:hypothetical protein [Alphaproteobacteria bacterium]MBV9694506.1 hypothetical protein [Alphaproteobacteria bacterium]